MRKSATLALAQPLPWAFAMNRSTASASALLFFALTSMACGDAGKDGKDAKSSAAESAAPAGPCADAKACAAACDAKTAGACVRAGDFLRKAIDKAGAIKAYDKGCSAGDQLACAYKGFTQAKGEAPDTDAYKQGTALAKKACDAEPKACGLLAALDYGIESDDFKRQRELNEKACKAGEQGACTQVGKNLYGEEATKAEGEKLLKTACEAKVMSACGWIKQPDTERIKYEGTICEEGNPGYPDDAAISCAVAAEAYAAGKTFKGEPFPQDAKKSAQLYKRGCDLGYQSCCGK